MDSSYIQIAINCLCVYLFMVIALRVFGKRELSQLNPIDIVLILLISNAVQNAMVTGDHYKSLKEGLVAASVLFILNFFLKKIMSKSKTINDLFEERPEILIHNGIVDSKALLKSGITKDELEEVIHEHGVQHFNEVRLAIMEIDGNISVISQTLKETHHKRKIHKTLGIINN